MTIKEQLFQAIEALPSTKLAEALILIKSLSTTPSIPSAKSFLPHLKTIGGDESIVTCTIVKGEPIDMAMRSQHRQANLALVQRFLNITTRNDEGDRNLRNSSKLSIVPQFAQYCHL